MALETILGGGHRPAEAEIRGKRALARVLAAGNKHEKGIVSMSAQCAPENTDTVAEIVMAAR